MSITLTPITAGHAFTRNPLLLSMPGTGQCVFSVYGQGYTSTRPAYKGEVITPVVVNLAEFIEAIIPPIDDPGEHDSMICYGLQDGSITIAVDDGSQDPPSWTICAHQGGVSKQNYRKLSQAGTDIFAARFLNPRCNFFLTTRTHDWRLNIKETELYPLVFFYPLQGTLSLKDIISGNTVSLPAVSNQVDYHGKICCINIKAIRQYFLDEYDCIANAFDVFVDDGPAARIVIQKARPQRERYRLKFRNSFGAFEIIELTGNAQINPTVEEDDENSYQQYQTDIDDFETARQRQALRQSIKITTGYKTNSELCFILDAIASDETYLLDMANDPVKVTVKADEMYYDHQPGSPQVFNIELTPVDAETCITGDIDSEVMPVRGGLFSPEFTEIFD